jgi:VIT1/CCC1 family predicted Fe2+/Mn2+ transporter
LKGPAAKAPGLSFQQASFARAPQRRARDNVTVLRQAPAFRGARILEMPKRSARPHPEKHLFTRIGWLRAAVLGANDGIISTASLIVGVASAATSASEVLVAGVA